jgi:transcriptional regulator with XRE-family HTH domain
MKEKGIKQIVIAHKTGISPTTLNAILNGKRTMYAEDLKAICIALGVSAATFINSDENPVVS